MTDSVEKLDAILHAVEHPHIFNTLPADLLRKIIIDVFDAGKRIGVVEFLNSTQRGVNVERAIRIAEGVERGDIEISQCARKECDSLRVGYPTSDDVIWFESCSRCRYGVCRKCLIRRGPELYCIDCAKEMTLPLPLIDNCRRCMSKCDMTTTDEYCMACEHVLCDGCNDTYHSLCQECE